MALRKGDARISCLTYYPPMAGSENQVCLTGLFFLIPVTPLTEYLEHTIILVFRGSLAQLVEQRTFNPLVAGSNPARPTTNIKDLGHITKSLNFLAVSSFGSLAQLVEQRTFNPLVAGSNPARPTKTYSKKPILRGWLFAFLLSVFTQF